MHYCNVLRSLSVKDIPNIASTTFKGTRFEYRSLRLLQDNLSMSLSRVGGANDKGIDLHGWWWLPKSIPSEEKDDAKRYRIRVLAQCKAERKPFGSRYVREMEGVLARSEDQTTVGVLVSESAFTAPSLKHAFSSSKPMLLIHLPDNEDAAIGTAVWNPALGGQSGLLEGKIDLRWERSIDGTGRPALWLGRRRIKNFSSEEIE